MDQQAALEAKTSPSSVPALPQDSEASALSVESSVAPSLFKDYLNLTKPGITMSNMMMTFTGLWLASAGRLPILVSILTLIGSSLVVMSGCTLNNYMDRDIDPLMARTQGRPLPNGRVKPWTVMVLGIVLGIVGLGTLGIFVNTISALMAMIGLFFYVIVYTGMTKRTTTLSTVVGSVSGAMPPLIGWTAVAGSLGETAWLLFAFMFIWQIPHFLSLGMRRVKDYAAAGIPLLPVVYGFEPTKRQIISWTAALLPISLMLYVTHAVSLLYVAVALVLGGIYLAKALRALRPRDDLVWATDMFKYSLIYLTAMSAAMVVGVA
ncbi:MAG: heme o synthase [Firmicutes bacterium]|nr:heme o synthase [Bacillota bacterium]